MSLRRRLRKKSQTKKGSGNKGKSPDSRDSFPDAFERVKQYERLYPHATVEGRKQVIADLKARVEAARALSKDPSISPKEKEKALAFSKVYEDTLERLPPPEAAPKKVPRPSRIKPYTKGRRGKSSPRDIQKREELARLLKKPYMGKEEELVAPPTLKLQKWKRTPKEVEHFRGREHRLYGHFSFEDLEWKARFNRTKRDFKRRGFETGEAEWKGKAYLYIRPTQRAGATVRQRESLPSKANFGPTKSLATSKGYRKFHRVGFSESLAEAEAMKNRMRRDEPMEVHVLRYSRGREKGLTLVGFAIYARYVKDPKRIPVVGGGESGKASPRQYREMMTKAQTARLAREREFYVGDKLDRYIGGKKTTLHPVTEPMSSFTEVSKKYDRLRRQGYQAVLKSYQTKTGVMRYVIFAGEQKSKERAEEYRKLKKRKKTVKLVKEKPSWPKEKTKYVVPSKPHPNAVLVMGAGATSLNGQQEIIRRQKALRKKGYETEVVFGTDTTHLYVVPREGEKKVVLPRTKYKAKRKKARLQRIYGTQEYWKERGVDIRQIEIERFVERTPSRISPTVTRKRRRSIKK